MDNNKPITLGIVGATGVVGQTALDLLELKDFNFSIGNLKLFASRSSAGKILTFKNKKIAIEEINIDSLLACNAVIFASEAAISQEFIPILSKHGILCVDKSSVFRLDPNVPLVVPEINSHMLQINNKKNYTVASPNCVAIPLSMVSNVLKQNYGLKRMVVSTYQSVSGSGKSGLDTLREETEKFLLDKDLSCSASAIYPKSIAFNVFPFVEKFMDDGYTGEEFKIIHEVKKILETENLPICVTSVRVPTFVGHCMSVTYEFEKSFEIQDLFSALDAADGICVVDERYPKGLDKCDEDFTRFISPRECQGQDFVFVSRIRSSTAFNTNACTLWIACNNLRKGAALNAIQIIDKFFSL